MFYVYLLLLSNKKIYKGFSENLKKGLKNIKKGKLVPQRIIDLLILLDTKPIF